jgi:(p)ppGpp synthase/HD superfamily hydrolase
MGYEAKKTEHCGAKHGNGAYWGYKWEAKKESSRTRRKNWRREIRDATNDAMRGESAAPPATR